jgi:hypothetical protein
MFSKRYINTIALRTAMIGPGGSFDASQSDRSMIDGSAQDNQPAYVAPATKKLHKPFVYVNQQANLVEQAFC